MSRITVIPSDQTVLVDGLPHRLTDFPVDAAEGIHAMQYADGRLEIEYSERGDGTRPRNSIHKGDEAQAMIQPFVDAWATVNSEALQRQTAQPEGTESFGAEKG